MLPLPDVLARVYWTRLCALLSLVESDAPAAADFAQAVVQALGDASERVFLEALSVLRLSAARLVDASLVVLADGKETRVSALRETHARLAELLDVSALPANTPITLPQVHAVLRVVAALAEAFIALPDVAALPHLSAHPLHAVLAPLGLIAARGAPHLRLMALKAALWLPTRHSSGDVEALINAEFRRSLPLPPRLLNDLFRELLRRLSATPWVFPFVLRLLHGLYVARPDLLVHVPLTELWRTVLVASDAGRAAALAALWAMLDAPLAPKHRLAMLRVHVRLYAFVGAHSVQLTAPPSPPALPSLSPALHALLLRLEAGVAHGSPDVVVVCVEALQAVALAHATDVRVRVFEFLVTCRMQPAVVQALYVLERLLAPLLSQPPPDLAALSALLGPDVRLTA